MTRGFPPLRGLLPLLVLLAVWQLIGSEASPFFPPPSSWVSAIAGQWAAGTLPVAALETLTTFAIALVVAIVLGTALGMAIGASARADRALGPSLAFARAIPPATVVPVAALLLGYDETMKVAVVTFAATWSILLSTRSGMRAVDPLLLDTAKTLRLNAVDTARKCVLPALLPSIFTGVRVATPVALAITLLVEVLTRVNGIGALIDAAQRSYLPGQVYGLLLVSALFTLLVTGAVSALEVYALRNRPPTGPRQPV